MRGVLLDLYGTLVSGLGGVPRDATSRTIAGVLGVDPDRFAAAVRDSMVERFVRALGDTGETMRALAVRLGGDPSPDAVATAVKHRMALARDQLHAGPGVLDALDRLRAAGTRLALVTNCSTETPVIWPESPLAERFDATVFSCEIGARKPEPAIYRAALDALGLPARHCAFAGDGAGGELPGAAAVGLTAVRVTGLADPAEDVGVWTGPTVATLNDLADLLESGGPR